MRRTIGEASTPLQFAHLVFISARNPSLPPTADHNIGTSYECRNSISYIFLQGYRILSDAKIGDPSAEPRSSFDLPTTSSRAAVSHSTMSPATLILQKGRSSLHIRHRTTDDLAERYSADLLRLGSKASNACATLTSPLQARSNRSSLRSSARARWRRASLHHRPRLCRAPTCNGRCSSPKRTPRSSQVEAARRQIHDSTRGQVTVTSRHRPRLLPPLCRVRSYPRRHR